MSEPWPEPHEVSHGICVCEEERNALEALLKAAQELDLSGFRGAVFGRSNFNAAIDAIKRGREGRGVTIDK